MAISAKHVFLVALVTLLLTYATYQGKSPSHGDAASLAGRKGLSSAEVPETTVVLEEDSVTTETESDASETTPVLAEDSMTESESDTSEDATVETIGGETSEESSDEAKEEETSEQTSEKTPEETVEQASEEAREEVSELVSEHAVEDTKESTTEETTTDESTTEVTTEDVTFVEESWNPEGNIDDVQTEENVDFSAESQESSAESSFEGKQVREMEEAMSPQGMAPQGMAPQDSSVADGPSTIIQNPDSSNYPQPKGNPNVYLQSIAMDNYMAALNEGSIQKCIKEDGCGDPGS